LCGSWLRQLVRAAKIARLYRAGNPVVDEARAMVHTKLAEILDRFGAVTMQFTPSEVFVGEECIVKPSGEGEILQRSAEEQLPMLLFGDGIRQITFTPHLPRTDTDAFIDALRDAGVTSRNHEDIVTLLWQANLTHIKVSSVPPQQTIFHSLRASNRADSSTRNQEYAWASGSELHALLGQSGGAQGLHRDRFDDRSLPAEGLDVGETFRKLETTALASRARLKEAWQAESAALDARTIGAFLEQLVRIDPSPSMSRAVARFVVSWIPDAIAKADWEAARFAYRLLRDVESETEVWEPELIEFLSKIDPVSLTERLEKSEAAEIGAFIEITLALGAPAVDLVCSVMAEAESPATRAATEVGLATLCAGEPDRLEPYLSDPRWYVVRNTAQVLGMVGGRGVGRLLRIALAHPDDRVVKEAIRSLARTPREEGLPVLIELLNTRDLKILSTTMSVLTRERNPVAARALLARIESPEFESEAEDLQRQVFSGLAEIAGDESITPLNAIVQRSGLFVRKTFTRSAAARTLARIGTPRAITALETGLKSKHEAVRSACRDALGRAA
jgi:hypothetical protein